MIKLSTVSKLDGIQSWSLPTLSTCPGAYDKEGLVEVCRSCYARDGNYHLPSVQRLRAHNREDWRRREWVEEMVQRLDPYRYLRWFDSGDVYHPRLAWKMLQVIHRTPWCKHWIPTRSHKITKIRPLLEQIAALPNACVRYSSDTFDAFTPGLHGSVVLTGSTPDGVTLCNAYRRQPARCDGCRACWDKSVAIIGYPIHGRSPPVT